MLMCIGHAIAGENVWQDNWPFDCQSVLLSVYLYILTGTVYAHVLLDVVAECEITHMECSTNLVRMRALAETAAV